MSARRLPHTAPRWHRHARRAAEALAFALALGAFLAALTLAMVAFAPTGVP